MCVCVYVFARARVSVFLVCVLDAKIKINSIFESEYGTWTQDQPAQARFGGSIESIPQPWLHVSSDMPSRLACTTSSCKLLSRLLAL